LKKHALKKLLNRDQFPEASSEADKAELATLQRRLFRIQQGIWHQRGRALIAFEGFDAAGKGGTIRTLTQILDPRGFRVHPVGPPTLAEKEQLYLSRFWSKLPDPGTLAVFDRTWYGRVLVERVEGLAPKARWRQAFDEIRHFEQMLVDDGIPVIKFFLAISKDEQRKRFEDRLRDPYKRWKLRAEDLEARKKWSSYVEAVDEMLAETHTSAAPWRLIPANDKTHARLEVLRNLIDHLKLEGDWIERAAKDKPLDLKAALRALKKG